MANYTAQALSFKFGYYKVCGNMEKSNQYFVYFFTFTITPTILCGLKMSTDMSKIAKHVLTMINEFCKLV